MALHPFTIRHSGRSFTSLGFDGRYFIWPIDEYLARTNHGPAVQARIRRLNPNGKPEGELPRGVHLKHRSGHLDAYGPREFIRRFGRLAYQDLPREAVHHVGHRKLIPATVVKELCGSA